MSLGVFDFGRESKIQFQHLAFPQGDFNKWGRASKHVLEPSGMLSPFEMSPAPRVVTLGQTSKQGIEDIPRSGVLFGSASDIASEHIFLQTTSTMTIRGKRAEGAVSPI